MIPDGWRLPHKFIAFEQMKKVLKQVEEWEVRMRMEESELMKDARFMFACSPISRNLLVCVYFPKGKTIATVGEIDFVSDESEFKEWEDWGGPPRMLGE